MLKLDPLPKVITFDCYGTLVQLHRALKDAARAILSAHTRDDDEDRPAALADRLRELAMTRQQRPPFRGYKAILRSSLNQALGDFGYVANRGDHERLLSALRAIEPHPEAPAALSRLRARYRLAIKSVTPMTTSSPERSPQSAPRSIS